MYDGFMRKVRCSLCLSVHCECVRECLRVCVISCTNVYFRAHWLLVLLSRIAQHVADHKKRDG
jgi:hypothetical protein